MRKIILRLLVGAGAVFVLVQLSSAQPEIIGEGQLPFRYLDRKLVPIHSCADSLYVLTVGHGGALLFRKVPGRSWHVMASLWDGGFEDAEFKVSRTGLPFVYNRWLNNLYFFDGFQFRDRPCPGRPVIDNHGNIHVFSDNSIYCYSTDTLSSFDIVDTVDISAEFVYLVSSPDDSIVGALFFDEQNDSLYKYLSFNGEPIDFASPSEVVAGHYSITGAFDIALDYSGTVYYVVNQDFADCPPWAGGCHYVWSEDFGFKFLVESSDDALDGTNFELTFSATPGEFVAVRSTCFPWGLGTSFFATTDAGATWYSCSYYVGGFYIYYGSTPRTYFLRLDFTYFTNEDTVYYLPIPRDSIFQNLVSVDENDIPLPNTFALEQNYPNPFNGSTLITYSLLNDALVKLAVFDISGKKVAVLENRRTGAGTYEVAWNGQNSSGQPVSSGVYFYRLSIDGDGSVTKRMLLIR
jgi:hypothetical protein